jgi:hypothetical protein
VCGNGLLEAPEVCDGAALDGHDCLTEGFDGGALACNANCDGLVTSGCFECGDGVVTGTELCDGADLDGQSCESLGLEAGTLACAADCTFDATACTGAGCVPGPAEIEFESGGDYLSRGDGWQSFTADTTGDIVEVDFYWNVGGTNDEFTMNIYEGVGTGGTLLHSELFPGQGVGVWVGFDTNVLSAAVPITAGSTYTIEGVDAFGWQTAQGEILGATSSFGAMQHKNIRVWVSPCE